MFIYSGMGWLVPAIWFAGLFTSSHLIADSIAWHGMKMSRAGAMFALAAIISTPLVFILGTLLNRRKIERKIFRFGREKTVYWGYHTFSLLPMEQWAAVIPTITFLLYAGFPLVVRLASYIS